MIQNTKAPVWFWIVAVVATLWNALGVMAYLQQAFMSAEQFAALPNIQQDLLSTQPFWVTAAFAIAVFAGFIGAVMLLIRKRIAVRLFLLSLVAVIIQFSSYFIIDGYMEFIAAQGWAMPVIIPIFAIGFVWIARHAEKNGIIR